MTAIAGAGAELVHIALQVVPPPICALAPSAPPLTPLLPQVAAPFLTVLEFFVVLLGLVGLFLRVVWPPPRRPVLFSCVRKPPPLPPPHLHPHPNPSLTPL